MTATPWQGIPQVRVPDKVRPWWLNAAIASAAIIVVGIALGDPVPTWIDAHVKPFFDDIYDWTVDNNKTNWLFTRVFNPISDAITWCTDGVLWILRNLRWPGVVALFGLIGYRTAGARTALVAVASLLACGILDLWDDTLITLSLMLVAVLIALVIGVPLGMWSAVSPSAERWLRGILDTSQVLPTFVYLLPAIVAFGIRSPSAVVVTVIYALAPVIRLTSLGIRSVPQVALEVGESFGCTPRQLMTKVRLPMARRTIMLGMNQVIMMAFGIVVIAALVGTGGLGQKVLDGLQKNNVGRAFAPGLALVFLAIALDRATTGDGGAGRPSKLFERLSGWRGAATGIGGVIAIAVLARLIGLDDFPSKPRIDVIKPINDFSKWMQEQFATGVPLIGGTKSFNDFFVIHILNRLRDLLIDPAWWIIILVFVLIGLASGGWRLATIVGLCLAAIAALRVWDLAMDTLSQVLVASFFSVLIAIPFGLWAGRSDRANTAMRPLLDAAQVMPQFVYLLPALSLFRVGRLIGVVASIIYAVPPGIRLISLGLREVPKAPREAAISFGATPRQELLKVQLPLAIRPIMLGVNQVILMVLSVVVIAGLVGGGGLGLEVIYGVTKTEIGRGVAAGVAIVMLAVVLDRITQAWGTPSSDQKVTTSIPAAPRARLR